MCDRKQRRENQRNLRRQAGEINEVIYRNTEPTKKDEIQEKTETIQSVNIELKESFDKLLGTNVDSFKEDPNTKEDKIICLNQPKEEKIQLEEELSKVTEVSAVLSETVRNDTKTVQNSANKTASQDNNTSSLNRIQGDAQLSGANQKMLKKAVKSLNNSREDSERQEQQKLDKGFSAETFQNLLAPTHIQRDTIDNEKRSQTSCEGISLKCQSQQFIPQGPPTTTDHPTSNTQSNGKTQMSSQADKQFMGTSDALSPPQVAERLNTQEQLSIDQKGVGETLNTNKNTANSILDSSAPHLNFLNNTSQERESLESIQTPNLPILKEKGLKNNQNAEQKSELKKSLFVKDQDDLNQMNQEKVISEIDKEKITSDSLVKSQEEDNNLISKDQNSTKKKKSMAQIIKEALLKKFEAECENINLINQKTIQDISPSVQQVNNLQKAQCFSLRNSQNQKPFLSKVPQEISPQIKPTQKAINKDLEVKQFDQCLYDLIQRKNVRIRMLNSSKKVKNQDSRKKAINIDSQISQTASKIPTIQNQIEEFKSQNKLNPHTSEPQLILAQSKEFKERKLDKITPLSKAQSINTFAFNLLSPKAAQITSIAALRQEKEQKQIIAKSAQKVSPLKIDSLRAKTEQNVLMSPKSKDKVSQKQIKDAKNGSNDIDDLQSVELMNELNLLLKNIDYEGNKSEQNDKDAFLSRQVSLKSKQKSHMEKSQRTLESQRSLNSSKKSKRQINIESQKKINSQTKTKEILASINSANQNSAKQSNEKNNQSKQKKCKQERMQSFSQKALLQLTSSVKQPLNSISHLKMPIAPRAPIIPQNKSQLNKIKVSPSQKTNMLYDTSPNSSQHHVQQKTKQFVVKSASTFAATKNKRQPTQGDFVDAAENDKKDSPNFLSDDTKISQIQNNTNHLNAFSQPRKEHRNRQIFNKTSLLGLPTTSASRLQNNPKEQIYQEIGNLQGNEKESENGPLLDKGNFFLRRQLTDRDKKVLLQEQVATKRRDGAQESLTNVDDGISSFALTQISNEKLSAKNFGTSYNASTNNALVNQKQQRFLKEMMQSKKNSGNFIAAVADTKIVQNLKSNYLAVSRDQDNVKNAGIKSSTVHQTTTFGNNPDTAQQQNSQNFQGNSFNTNQQQMNGQNQKTNIYRNQRSSNLNLDGTGLESLKNSKNHTQSLSVVDLPKPQIQNHLTKKQSAKKPRLEIGLRNSQYLQDQVHTQFQSLPNNMYMKSRQPVIQQFSTPELLSFWPSPSQDLHSNVKRQSVDSAKKIVSKSVKKIRVPQKVKYTGQKNLMNHTQTKRGSRQRQFYRSSMPIATLSSTSKLSLLSPLAVSYNQFQRQDFSAKCQQLLNYNTSQNDEFNNNLHSQQLMNLQEKMQYKTFDLTRKGDQELCNHKRQLSIVNLKGVTQNEKDLQETNLQGWQSQTNGIQKMQQNQRQSIGEGQFSNKEKKSRRNQMSDKKFATFRYSIDDVDQIDKQEEEETDWLRTDQQMKSNLIQQQTFTKNSQQRMANLSSEEKFGRIRMLAPKQAMPSQVNWSQKKLQDQFDDDLRKQSSQKKIGKIKLRQNTRTQSISQV